MTPPPPSIVILGGDTAGWMAACLIARSWPQARITVIESPDIGIIGVGEGSTPQLKALFDTLGIPEADWMPAADATYKAGIAFHGWADDTPSYFHPFADPLVVAGQGTVGLEILEQVADVDTVLVAIGGDGLISGVSTAIKSIAPHVRVIGIAAAGSPTLLRSLEAGRNIDIGRATTSVATMSCSHTDPRIFDIVRKNVDGIVLVEDAEMAAAAKWLWFEMGLAADLSGAAAIAALQQGRVAVKPGEKICAIVCGAGPDALTS